jgi:hypothetical protein
MFGQMMRCVTTIYLWLRNNDISLSTVFSHIPSYLDADPPKILPSLGEEIHIPRLKSAIITEFIETYDSIDASKTVTLQSLGLVPTLESPVSAIQGFLRELECLVIQELDEQTKLDFPDIVGPVYFVGGDDTTPLLLAFEALLIAFDLIMPFLATWQNVLVRREERKLLVAHEAKKRFWLRLRSAMVHAKELGEQNDRGEVITRLMDKRIDAADWVLYVIEMGIEIQFADAVERVLHSLYPAGYHEF